MFCPECGTENPDDARFCGGCGKPISATAPRPEAQGAAKFVDPRSAKGAVPGGLKYGVMAASLLLPVVGIGMGLYYMAKGDSEDEKAVGRLWLWVGVGIVLFYLMLGSGEF